MFLSSNLIQTRKNSISVNFNGHLQKEITVKSANHAHIRPFFEIIPTISEKTFSIKNIIRFLFSMSELVANDTSLACFGHFGKKREKKNTRFLVKPEVTKQFCWFSIAKMGLPMATSHQNLNKIGQKFGPWECRIGKIQNGSHDVIKLRYQKSEKIDFGTCPWDYLCKFSSKSAQPFRL